MAEFPVPLDTLIAYVKTLHSEGGPLENVTDAFAVSTQLDEQADALIGYFVDQARRSGASWNQIGTAMGVSKQAAQKRFVPTKAADLMAGNPQPFSRFTPRAACALGAAGKLAAPHPVSAGHLAAAVLSEPAGIAARTIAKAGLTPGQVYAAVSTGPAEKAENIGSAELLDLNLDGTAREALKGALKSALRRGHDYIGTEHLLLGVVTSAGPAAGALASLGLTTERTEEIVSGELAAYAAGKAGS